MTDEPYATNIHRLSPYERENPPGIVPSHGISINLPTPAVAEHHPLPVRHLSAPAYQSPLRHHKRAPSRSKQVKETLNARSHYGSSDDDGGAIHRINQYIIKQEIGRGSFGAVHLAVDQYGNEHAVKEFSKSRLRKRAQSNLLRKPNQQRHPGHLAAGIGFNSPLHRMSSSDKLNGDNNNSLSLIKEEIAIMKKLDHPNLVTLIEVLDDPQEDSLYMVLEMCKKGVVMKVGLDERAEPYEEEACRCWFRDMILGIEYLHAQGIIHRDIKPDNCLITHDDVLKIVDFGVSEMFEKESDMNTTKSAGSPAFMPPELCVVRHGPVSGKAADIWSMGVTLYCLRYGHIPFEKSGMLELYESIKSEEAPLDEEQNESFRDLMRRLLEKDAEKRITMEELREHPWVTKSGADPMMPAEENCATIVEPPTEAEMDQAITGNMAHLMVVMKAVKRFKDLLARRRPQFMDGIFGRDTRIVAPPHTLHGSSRSADSADRRPIETVLTTEGVHRDMNQEILKATHAMDRRRISTDHISGPDYPKESLMNSPEQLKPEIDSPRADSFPTRAQTLPVDEHAKGHAHDPLQDRLFLHIGAGADNPHSGTDESGDPIVSESPGGVEDDIYESAYQEEIKRILEERENANIHLTRRVEHIESLRKHPNIVSGPLNDALNLAGSTARRMDNRIRTGGFAALVRDARDKARATVAEAESSNASLFGTDTAAGREARDESQAAADEASLDGSSKDTNSAADSDARSPRPETMRLRDYAKASASTALKGLSRRIDETAARLDSRGRTQPYPET
ncbi:Ca2+ calmodulin-dependent kinase [Lecanosticta acicola]|uniref:Ca2+ calmodulin-dependent kinase n=1 Tax=Lecanosticta acicola TaxID=111012 RepID=A0AAI9E4R9_9PEZI|nr:Ca2+ calmodulin-dependent kinase [Lecanosticta acicola]